MTSRFALFVIGVAGSALMATAAVAAEPKALIRGEIDADLRAELVRAIGEVDAAPTNRFEARRRARSAMAAAESLLRSEGYYQPVLEDVVEGEETPVAIVSITPGRRFVLAAPTVHWTDPAPDAGTDRAVRDEIRLTPGDPGRAVEVIAAEGRIVAGLSRRGYADATAEPRRVVVDHAAFTVQPTYNIASGSLVRLDGVVLDTRGPTNPAWVGGLAPWEKGQIYNPDDVGELERRLLETGVYDGVGVALAPADRTNADGNRPVIVTLTDRPRWIQEAGITVSTARATVSAGTATSATGGSAIEGTWTYHNRFGRADTLKYQARLSDIDSRLGVDLTLPHWRRPGQTLTMSAAIVNEDTNAYRRSAVVLLADARQRMGRSSWYSYGVGVDVGQYDENRFDPVTLTPVNFNRDLIVLTGRGSAFLDHANDPLDPSSGWRLTLSVQPTAVAGEDTVAFLRAESQVTAYLPLDKGAKTVLAGRVRLGSIIGGTELTVPSDRLFYSGGAGSVRGYEYQGVGPRLPDNTPRGGISLFETSVEMRRDVGHNFQAVGFVDAGVIGFQETPNLTNLRYGAGFGVRYKLPFGPIRADIAFPLDRRDGDAAFQVYVSIGQAF